MVDSADCAGIVSVHQYYKLYRECAGGRPLTMDDLVRLVEQVSRELVVSGFSSLLNLVYEKCAASLTYASEFPHTYRRFSYEPEHFRLDRTKGDIKMTVTTAYSLLWLVYRYVGDSLSQRDVEKCLPVIFSRDARLEMYADDANKCFYTIDDYVYQRRFELYEASRSPHAGEAEGPSEAMAGRGAESGNGSAETPDVTSRQPGETSAADRQTATAIREIRGRAHAEEQERVDAGLRDVRTALMEANELMRGLERTVSEANVRKASDQLLDLYNLIADTRDSLAGALRRSAGELSEPTRGLLMDTLHNLGEFLIMISEYLADYGIDTIATDPGEPFAPKLQAVRSDVGDFDPRTAVVVASRRNGFIWGEQVLQKELVEIGRRG